ncbi:MAG: transposase, partial [Deltaproteobacteria bacterium]|nr:transposase [Deltaproteobacteria bacterium]
LTLYPLRNAYPPRAVRSMSRKGDCWDNAVGESFFATLQHECLRERTFDDTFEALADYIDDFYNTERLHSANGYVSPVEFELRTALLQEAAKNGVRFPRGSSRGRARRKRGGVEGWGAGAGVAT